MTALSGEGTMQRLLGQCAACLCGQPRVLPKGVGHGRFGEGLVDTMAPLVDCALLVDRFDLEGGLPSDSVLAELAFAVRAQLAPPRHSNFRVVCLILYRLGGQLRAEIGANSEVVSLAGGCCAERCAIAKLVTRFGGRTPLEGVERLVLVSDAPSCVLPGYACRELLSEHLDSDVPITCAWYDSQAKIVGVPGRRPQLRRTSVRALQPHPCAYRHVARGELATFAEQLAAKCAAVPADARSLFEKTLQTAQEVTDAHRRVHPAQYAAGALFHSGELRACSAAPAIEFPCSIDAVARLSVHLEERQQRGDLPKLLMVCDRWGVLHAPFAVGRSYLLEHGFSDVDMLVHDDAGELCTLKCSDLSGVDGVRIDCM